MMSTRVSHTVALPTSCTRYVRSALFQAMSLAATGGPSPAPRGVRAQGVPEASRWVLLNSGAEGPNKSRKINA